MPGRHRAARDGPVRSCGPCSPDRSSDCGCGTSRPTRSSHFSAGFLKRAVAAGIPQTEDLGGLDGEIGCGSEPMNVVDGVRWNTAFAYLDPVRGRSGLTIVPEATVDRVLTANGPPSGARPMGDGEPIELRAGRLGLG